MVNNNQHIRQANTQNGTIFQQPVHNGIMTTPTSIVRVNQPQNSQQQQQHQLIQNQGQYLQQTLWTNSVQQSPQQHQQHFTLQKQTQSSSVLQYATVKNGMRKLIYFNF